MSSTSPADVSKQPSASPTSSRFPSSSHTPYVQPHPSFFRVSRPNGDPVTPPHPTSQVSPTRAAFQLAAPPSPSRTRSGSVSSRGAKRNREPLLPIGATVPVLKQPPSPRKSEKFSRPWLGRGRSSLTHDRDPEKFDAGPGSSAPRSSMSSAGPVPIREFSPEPELTPVRASYSRPRGGSNEDGEEQYATRPVVFSRLSASIHTPRATALSDDMHDTDGDVTADSFRMRRISASTRQTAPSHPWEPVAPPDAQPFRTRPHPKTGKPVRNWRMHVGENVWFFKGHVLMGGDSALPFIAAFAVVLGLTGSWLGTSGVWWWHNESPAVACIGAYMCLIVISSMLATAFRDPGIIPRNLDESPPVAPGSPNSDGMKQALNRELRIHDDTVTVKYCGTCRTYRPPRSSHCKTCDNCVDGCDHHCQWVNNCVGRRNYSSFITFIVMALLTLSLVLVTTALELSILSKREQTSFRHTLSTTPGPAVVFCLAFVVFWPLLALFGYHVRLLLLNITTIEQVRHKIHSSLMPSSGSASNPFSLGRWHRNVAYLLCRPAGYSWIDGPGLVMVDCRELNPGVERGVF